MFAVDDINNTVARLRAHGAELLGEVAQYRELPDAVFRGPAGLIVGLAAMSDRPAQPRMSWTGAAPVRSFRPSTTATVVDSDSGIGQGHAYMDSFERAWDTAKPWHGEET